MKPRKDWLQETWEIKEKMAKETRGFSCDSYWQFIDQNAKQALKTMGRSMPKTRAGRVSSCARTRPMNRPQNNGPRLSSLMLNTDT